jgi:hypothetical protein
VNLKCFGDAKDLFKYDLITTIMKGLRDRDISRITIIPMITKYDPDFKGNPGCRNTNLIACFRRLRRTEEVDRYYDELKDYLKELKDDLRTDKVKVRIEKKEIFSGPARNHYFQGIYENFPQNSLIFVDPDTGIREKQFTEKHLSFQELGQMYRHLDENSILMVYQHYQRRAKTSLTEPEKKAGDVKAFTGCTPLVIADNTVMFIFLTRNAELRVMLAAILRNYARIEQAAARKKNVSRSIEVTDPDLS